MADEDVITNPEDKRLPINQKDYGFVPEKEQKKDYGFQPDQSISPKITTFYYPQTPEATRAAGLSYRMEGGTQGGPGFGDLYLPEYTFEKFKAGKAPYVAAAMQGEPTGKYYNMIVQGTPVIVRHVDKGSMV